MALTTGTRLGPYGIFVESNDAGARRRLTNDGHSPYWLADSRRIVYLKTGAIWLLDTVTRRECQRLAAPAPWRLSNSDLAQDERSLRLLETMFESDIWLMTEE